MSGRSGDGLLAQLGASGRYKSAIAAPAAINPHFSQDRAMLAQRFGLPALFRGGPAAHTGRIVKGRKSDGEPMIKPGRVEL
jgi:hypothetical protein